MFVSLSLLHAEVSGANTTSEFKPVDPNRIPQILNMIAEQARNNYERIRTWQGKKDVVIDYISYGTAAEKVFKTQTEGKGDIPKAIKNRRERIIEFAVDVDKDLLYVNNDYEKPLRYTDLETARNLGVKGTPSRSRSIVTPEYYIHCSPNTMRNGSIINRKAVKEAIQECPTCDGPSVFDPRELFGLPLQPVWVTFPRRIKVIKERGEYSIDGYALKVEERTEGGITEYRIQEPGKLSLEPSKLNPGNYLFKTRTFSSAKGFNVILEETTRTDGKLFQKLTWDYALVDGVYLPSKTTKQNFDWDSGGLTYETESVFRSLQLNHSIPAETFTYKNLGLKDDDPFVDKIESKEYKYKDKKLVFVADVNEEPVKKPVEPNQ